MANKASQCKPKLEIKSTIRVIEGPEMTSRVFMLCPMISIALLLSAPQRTFSQTDQSSINLTVDATEAPKKILHSRETISVHPGALTLFYPKWIPGEHGPTGPVIDMAGLKIIAGGKSISWRRDLEEMFAIHCEVPRGSAGLTSRLISFFHRKRKAFLPAHLQPLSFSC